MLDANGGFSFSTTEDLAEVSRQKWRWYFPFICILFEMLTGKVGWEDMFS